MPLSPPSAGLPSVSADSTRILEVSTVSTAIDLPTLDVLRDEQRSLRAQLAQLRGRLHRQLALEFAADAALVLTGTAAVLVLPRLVVPVRSARASLLARLSRSRGSSRSWASARPGDGGRRGSTSSRWR